MWTAKARESPKHVTRKLPTAVNFPRIKLSIRWPHATRWTSLMHASYYYWIPQHGQWICINGKVLQMLRCHLLLNDFLYLFCLQQWKNTTKWKSQANRNNKSSSRYWAKDLLVRRSHRRRGWETEQTCGRYDQHESMGHQPSYPHTAITRHTDHTTHHIPTLPRLQTRNFSPGIPNSGTPATFSTPKCQDWALTITAFQYLYNSGSLHICSYLISSESHHKPS